MSQSSGLDVFGLKCGNREFAEDGFATRKRSLTATIRIARYVTCCRGRSSMPRPGLGWTSSKQLSSILVGAHTGQL